MSSRQPILTQIRKELDKLYNKDELRTFVYDMGIDYDNLPGETKSDKARELLLHCERRGITKDLVKRIIQDRQNAAINESMLEALDSIPSDDLEDIAKQQKRQSMSPRSSITTKFGDNASGNIIAQSNGGDITIGDTSTSAEKRYKDSLASIKSELLSNFSSLAMALQSIESRSPKFFWDTRRPNETELAYQDRAKDAFRDYQQEINQYLQPIKFSRNVFSAFERDVAYNPDMRQRIKDVYDQQNEVLESFTSYISGLQYELALSLSDVERTTESTSLHKEKIANAKMALAYAAAHFCLVPDQEIDIRLLSEALSLAGVVADFVIGNEGYRSAMKVASVFAGEKVNIIGERLGERSKSAKREIERRVHDPYLLMLRNATGLPPTLKVTEEMVLQSKQIDQGEQRPEKLFELAAFSYLESDGRASAIYFRRAIDTNLLSPILRQFAEVSVDRIENPDRYDGSIGIMIMKLTGNGNFEKSELKMGDVIVSANMQIVNEPIDIASVLLQKDRVLLGIVRAGQKMITTVSGGEPAGAVLTQLVILNTVQL